MVTYKGRTIPLVLYIANHGTTLLGLDGVAAFKLQIDGFMQQCMETTLESTKTEEVIRNEFPQLFAPGLGLTKGYMHLVKVRKEVQPVATKLRPLPLAVREEVSTELQRLLQLDVMEPITASEYGSPIVVVS